MWFILCLECVTILDSYSWDTKPLTKTFESEQNLWIGTAPTKTGRMVYTVPSNNAIIWLHVDILRIAYEFYATKLVFWKIETLRKHR